MSAPKLKMNRVICPKCCGMTWTELRFLPTFCSFCGVNFEFSEKTKAENAAIIRQEETA